MSAAKHTPGLLVRDTRGHPSPDIRAASGRAVANTWMVCASSPKTAAGYQARSEEDRANADRLVAAWNACDGISTEALADGAVAGLLAALQGLDEAYCRAGAPLTRDERNEDRQRLIAARAAIAKATGGAA